VSGHSDAPYETTRYAPRGEPSQPPLRVRRQILIDSARGQRLADQAEARLTDAARRAEIIDCPGIIDPDERAAQRRAAHEDAVTAHVDAMPGHAGCLGPGVALGSPAAVLAYTFGLDR